VTTVTLPDVAAEALVDDLAEKIHRSVHGPVKVRVDASGVHIDATAAHAAVVAAARRWIDPTGLRWQHDGPRHVAPPVVPR
jgi:hypothetical protein